MFEAFGDGRKDIAPCRNQVQGIAGIRYFLDPERHNAPGGILGMHGVLSDHDENTERYENLFL
jgi:hypothetical protein